MWNTRSVASLRARAAVTPQGVDAGERHDAVVALRGVRKSFGRRAALRDVSLTIARGEIVALLGPNGAGKSTTFGLILGHLRPDAGDVLVHGISVVRDRRHALARVGAMPEAPAFYDYLTGWENLEVFTTYSGGVARDELERAVRFVGLGARIHDRVRGYSRGMRQRLALAQALVPTPDVILLDEPADGLDPEGMADMRRLLLRLRDARRVAVVVASHLLAEVEGVCDRAVILDEGRIVFDGRSDDPRNGARDVRIVVDDWARALPVLERAGAERVTADTVTLPPGIDAADLVALLVRAGVRVSAVGPVTPRLADLYLDVTARSRRGGDA